MNSPILHTRRAFLRCSALGGALTGTVPSFLAATFDRLHTEAEGSAIAATTGRDATILVLLQLAGGNDGLNTVIPRLDDEYRKARPTLGLDGAAVLKLSDAFGLHPALKGLQTLHDEGRLATIHAVGYPNANRSHFRSTDIWMTATDSDQVSSQGWIGRYFDHACPGADPVIGVAVARQNPLAFASQKPAGVAVNTPEAYRYVAGDDPADDEEEGAGGDRFYRRMTRTDGDALTGSLDRTGGSIEAAGGTPPSGSALDYLERTALQAQVSSDQIRSVSERVRNRAAYPNSRLARDLQFVARMIAGGLSTRVYFVSHGGYDTHTQQAPTHQRLLSELGDALAAFQSDLGSLGQQERVVVMTFSEFGRRVSENASGGTDHGAAAPLFIIGEHIRPGFHGVMPSLAPDQRLHGDLQFTTDFRQVYTTVLEQWLRTPAAPILGRAFPALNLFA
ncbi:MAG: DUF1501 domain-containing protein [Verrucomicrobia bacterium]|nr:DUF1501 domain-containing protein [Verrucomicrobiota bacterium]